MQQTTSEGGQGCILTKMNTGVISCSHATDPWSREVAGKAGHCKAEQKLGVKGAKKKKFQ